MWSQTRTRWRRDGLALDKNFAYFIHSNTDVVVLTLFTASLKAVSVYSVYLLVVKNLQSLFKAFSNAFNPMIGKAIAVNDYKQASKYMETYEFVVSNVATIIFGCCIYLLPSFVLIYTHGVTDTNYYRVIFFNHNHFGRVYLLYPRAL